MRKRSLLAVVLLLTLGGCLQAQGSPPFGKIANPASENCLKQGGQTILTSREDGSQFGICSFAEGGECEEWALFRGECPGGGVDVSGLATSEARYCVITGGRYSAVEEPAPQGEKGICAFPSGKVCDAWEYYRGRCGSGR